MKTLRLVCLSLFALLAVAQAPDVSPATPAPAVGAAPEVVVPAPSAPAAEPAPAPAPVPEAAPAPAVAAAPLPPVKVVKLAPGPEAQAQIQEALIVAEPGTVFEFAEGRYPFTMGLSLTIDKCTLRGAGMDKTIFDFSAQDAGSEGLLVTSNGVLLEDFAIENAKGNCFKSNAANDLIVRRVRTEWTGGSKESNGAYGLYPVAGKNVLVEGCVVKGASDAGIYVGQSENVIVRRNQVELNVAGIEIENCYFADVYENTSTNNTGGILVFDLPGLPKQRGHNIRVFKNQIFNNNTKNFAPVGNIVAKVPTGTGVMIMSNSNVHVFENTIKDHGTLNVMLCSYLVSGNEITDKAYYPFPEGISIHDNTFGNGGNAPAGEFGLLASGLTGVPLPDILWDGVMNSEKMVNNEMPAELRVYITGNKKEEGGEITFANVNALIAMTNPANLVVTRDLAPHQGALPELPPIVIPGVN